MAFQAQLSRIKGAFAFMLMIVLTLVKMYKTIKTYKKYMKVNSGNHPTKYIFGMFLQCPVLSGTSLVLHVYTGD